MSNDNEDKFREAFTRWVQDPDSNIAIFENQDLGHYNCGHRIALNFGDVVASRMEVGKTRAPDHPRIGLGWRYVLVKHTKDVDEALQLMKVGVDAYVQ